MKKINNKILFNIIGFYICWWISVYAATKEVYYAGPLIVIIFLFIHAFKVISYNTEILFLVICYLIGFLIDTFFLRLGIIEYKGLLPEKYNLAPVWVTCLWVCFGTSISHSFKWVRKQYKFLALLGAISGPIIYFSASKVGALLFNVNYYYLFVVGLCWSLFLPLIVYISDRIVK
tara:strand:- start:1094 stop:1618 length:525 start_codon:yes stop_codon:yes gene_type:complete